MKTRHILRKIKKVYYKLGNVSVCLIVTDDDKKINYAGQYRLYEGGVEVPSTFYHYCKEINWDGSAVKAEFANEEFEYIYSIDKICFVDEEIKDEENGN
jgi:hypothetical protein